MSGELLDTGMWLGEGGMAVKLLTRAEIAACIEVGAVDVTEKCEAEIEAMPPGPIVDGDTLVIPRDEAYLFAAGILDAAWDEPWRVGLRERIVRKMLRMPDRKVGAEVA